MIRPGLRLVPWRLLPSLKNLTIWVSLSQLVFGGINVLGFDQDMADDAAALRSDLEDELAFATTPCGDSTS